MEEGEDVPETHCSNEDLIIQTSAVLQKWAAEKFLGTFILNYFVFLPIKLISQQHNNQWVYFVDFEAGRKQVQPLSSFIRWNSFWSQKNTEGEPYFKQAIAWL